MAELSRRVAGRLSEDSVKKKLAAMSPEKRKQLAMLIARFQQVKQRDDSRLDYKAFVRAMWPGFIEAPHIDVLASVFQRIDAGESVRVVINIAPRMGKSKQAAVYFPAWFIGKHPDKQIIQASNVKSLAEGFGGEVRNLIASEEYQKIFPGISLSDDTKAKGKWNTNRGGKYFAVGMTGTVIGKGADLLIIDDPHGDAAGLSGESNLLPPKKNFEKVIQTYSSLRTRLQPNASILVVMQRWAPFDLTGFLLESMKLNPNGDQWEIITLPVMRPIPDLIGEDGKPVYQSSWPDYWPIAELMKTKNTMPAWKWNAMYMQDPRSEEAAIIKREYWRVWGRRDDGTMDERLVDSPPKCDYVIQSWDMAATAKTRSNYSACTTWGVFRQGDDGGYRIILLNALRGKWEFPDLKAKALEQFKKWEPDTLLIEAASAGYGIIQELQRAGIPVRTDKPVGNQYGLRGDKVVRLNAVSDLFFSGMVYAPAYVWADEVIEELAQFPNGENDDYVDSTTQALKRFRQGGFIQLATDEKMEEYTPVSANYY